jgi:Domain of unknown function (DUF1707)
LLGTAPPALASERSLPQMRASDADRDGVVAALSEHFQTGRLTREELDERTGRALTARTLDELDELTADLPAIRPAGPAPVIRPRGLGYLLLTSVAAALAALAIAALVLGVDDGRHGWDWWWIIPAGLLFARRLAGRAVSTGTPGGTDPPPDTQVSAVISSPALESDPDRLTVQTGSLCGGRRSPAYCWWAPGDGQRGRDLGDWCGIRRHCGWRGVGWLRARGAAERG